VCVIHSSGTMAEPWGAEMSDRAVGPLRRVLAVVCHHCPVCRHAREHPESFFGRVLHHPLHANYCPMWKAENSVYDADRRQAGSAGVE